MSSIGNLLAQISGGSSSQAPPPRASSASRPERRTEPSMRPTPVSRPAPNPTSGTNASRSVPTPSSRPVQRPTSSTRSLPSQPPTRPNPATRPSTAASHGISKPGYGASRSGSSALKATPRPVQPSTSAPPKKGSYAEIMARAQRAQEVMGQVGKIQHKKVEKGLSKKERMEQMDRMKAEQKAAVNKKPVSTARVSNARVGGEPAPGVRKSAIASGPKAKKPAEPEKKIRKPPPSTGYTGTARPSAPVSKPKNHTPGGALLKTSTYKRSRSASRYEPEDEELDDFIDDDEDEEEDPRGYGRQYRYDDYDSDGSSDMEAGLNEIDHEEAMAERIARNDDRLEEERERQRKAEKERRKRELLRGR
ncbi:hypothetical protein BROUX41_002299 [Berkeleyomyces rouxiae]|uniref:uncharacterized protein n=1 Tax=Berkeleyomyces rouxiae TaxID=2035830 RepID=UPI003B781E1D